MGEIKLSKRVKDMAGKVFYRLTVIRPYDKDVAGIRWLCRCECGNTKVVRGSSLRNGSTKSCGCYNKDSHIKHGYDGTPTYKSWCSMKERCNNKNHIANERYGKLGYAKRWDKFINFLADMGERPNGKTLDRIDNGKGYSRANCRWVSPYEQAQNRKTSVTIEYKGDVKILTQWAKEFGMNYATFFGRYRRGWSMSEIENTPILKRKLRE